MGDLQHGCICPRRFQFSASRSLLVAGGRRPAQTKVGAVRHQLASPRKALDSNPLPCCLCLSPSQAKPQPGRG